jgi:hypothetical protein
MRVIGDRAALAVSAQRLIDATGPLLLRQLSFKDGFSSFVRWVISLRYSDYRCGIVQKPCASTPNDGLNLLR